MIDVRNLSKFYGATRSLDGLTFSVPEGEVLGLLGPNGAGKTTAMRILTGQTRATSGSARVAGFDVATEHLKIRRLLGYLPEDSPVYPEMRVEEYLKMMAGLKDLPATHMKREIDRVLDETNLLGVRRRLIGNLSKGNRQRVGIAQALLGDPALLVLDEPTVGLDPKQIAEVCELIRSMRGERTVILSTHILSNVSMTCSCVVIIKDGRLVAEGPVETIGDRVRGRRLVLRVRGGEENGVRSAVASAGGFPPEAIEVSTVDAMLRVAVAVESGTEDKRAAIARRIVEEGWELIELTEDRATLEDIFLHATASGVERPA
ncbi:MAG: gliding motility-associated transport system ATP-binding protein [Candidatus Sumerlaeota bacterium]|nr:gliding motility-associated transport system ATP-binding protein [Candidatus Sumerlaeota bacterium]